MRAIARRAKSQFDRSFGTVLLVRLCIPQPTVGTPDALQRMAAKAFDPFGRAMIEQAYDFHGARQHRERVVALYRKARRHIPESPGLIRELRDEVEEMDREIAEAHKNKTIVLADDRQVKHLTNLINPSIPQWGGFNQ